MKVYELIAMLETYPVDATVDLGIMVSDRQTELAQRAVALDDCLVCESGPGPDPDSFTLDDAGDRLLIRGWWG